MTILHASCVAFNRKAALITGASGAGKSSLALNLLSLGGKLISDDRTEVSALNDALTATCPSPAIAGRLEARGVGILMAPHQESAQVELVIDLQAGPEDRRMPPARTTRICDVTLPLLHRSKSPDFAQAVWLYLTQGPAND